MKTTTSAFLMTLLALGVGCGDDDDVTETDMNPPMTDMNPPGEDMNPPEEDMGPEEDMFVPTPVVFVRVAHLIPDAPNLRLCIGQEGTFPMLAPTPPTDDPDAPGGIPFRAVGDYTALPIDVVTTYEARFYDVDEIGDMDCSIEDEPLLRTTVDVSTLTASAHYTVALVGLVTPADYQCPTATPGVTTPCGDDKLPSVEIFDDAEVDATMTQIRVLHGIPNAPNIDVCYDADGSAGDTEDPVEIIENLSFREASDYFESADEITTGSFRVYVHIMPGLDCPTAAAVGFDAEIAELPVPTPGPIVDGFSQLRVNVDYQQGEVSTIFAQGDANVDPPNPGFRAIVPLLDLPEE